MLYFIKMREKLCLILAYLIANTPYLNTLLTFEAEISTISQNNYHSINRSVPEGSRLVSRRRRRRGRTDPVGKFGTTSTRGALPAAHNGCPPSDHSSTAGTPSRHQLKSGGGGTERRSAAVPTQGLPFRFFSESRQRPETKFRRNSLIPNGKRIQIQKTKFV